MNPFRVLRSDTYLVSPNIGWTWTFTRETEMLHVPNTRILLPYLFRVLYLNGPIMTHQYPTLAPQNFNMAHRLCFLFNSTTNLSSSYHHNSLSLSHPSFFHSVITPSHHGKDINFAPVVPQHSFRHNAQEIHKQKGTSVRRYAATVLVLVTAAATLTKRTITTTTAKAVAISTSTSPAVLLSSSDGKSTSRKPNGYWKDFENLRNELNAFAQQHSDTIQVDMPAPTEGRALRKHSSSDAHHNHTRLILPTGNFLRIHGRRDIENAIMYHGGFYKVANTLGWTYGSFSKNNTSFRSRKPRNYWNNWDNVEKQLTIFMLELDNTSPFACSSLKFPTMALLRSKGRSDLQQAILRHGGIRACASRMGLSSLSAHKKPRGYWKDWNNIQHGVTKCCALLAAVSRHDINVMPSRSDLRKHGFTDLANAISKIGYQEVATRLNLVIVKSISKAAQRSKSSATKFYHFARDLLLFVKSSASTNQTVVLESHVRYNYMPDKMDLLQANRKDLVVLVKKFGGFSMVARRLGLRIKSNRNDFLKSKELLRAGMMQIVTRHLRQDPQSLKAMRLVSCINNLDFRQDMREAFKAMGQTHEYVLRDSFCWFALDLLSIAHHQETHGWMPTADQVKRTIASSTMSQLDLENAIKCIGVNEISMRLGLILKDDDCHDDEEDQDDINGQLQRLESFMTRFFKEEDIAYAIFRRSSCEEYRERHKSITAQLTINSTYFPQDTDIDPDEFDLEYDAFNEDDDQDNDQYMMLDGKAGRLLQQVEYKNGKKRNTGKSMKPKKNRSGIGGEDDIWTQKLDDDIIDFVKSGVTDDGIAVD